MAIVHDTVATKADEAGAEVNKAEWNADHTIEAGTITATHMATGTGRDGGTVIVAASDANANVKLTADHVCTGLITLVYDGGSGGVPNVTDVVTGTSSGAKGVISAVSGDATSGTLTLTTLTVAVFTNNEAITAPTNSFAAVADGSTLGDEVQIQAAIDALPTAGGSVVLSEGTFTIVNTILPTTKTTLTGQGQNITILDCASKDHGISIDTVNWVTVSNLEIDGTNMIAGVHGIRMDGANDISIFNVYVHDITSHGIHTKDVQCARLQVRNCRVTDCDLNGCITLDFCIDSVVSDCYCARSQLHGIQVYDGSGSSDNVTITNCVIDDAGTTGTPNGTGIQIQGGGAGTTTNITISNCIITNSYKAGIKVTAASNVNISNCRVNGTNAAGNESGINIRTGSTDVTVTGCEVTGADVHGIYLRQLSAGHIVISGNNLNNNGVDGIQVEHVSTEFCIVGNICTDNGDDGINMSAGASDNYTVIANMLTGNSGTNLVDDGSGSNKAVQSDDFGTI